MFIINVALILIYIMLAVLSRKHFSKYKNKGGAITCITGLFYGMGELLWEQYGKKKKKGDIQKSLRKCHVASQNRLEEMEKNWYAKGFALTLGILFIFNLLSGLIGLRDVVEAQKDNIEIVRDGYGGYEEKYVINLDTGENTEQYSLAVAPVEYSPEEIAAKAREVFSWLEESVYGENKSAECIEHDLYFPTEDPEGIFQISWQSDNPMLITSGGRLLTENISSPEKGTVTATLHYMDSVFERQFVFCPGKEQSEKSTVDCVKETLVSLEKNSRDEKGFFIPQNIDGISISLDNGKKVKGKGIFEIGIIVCICVLAIRREGIKKETKKRDDMLLLQYPLFVNKLYLLLQTGITVKNALACLTSDKVDSLLKGEIQYSLNQIASGMEEGRVYRELGERLHLPEYVRLMNKVAGNIKGGNSNLPDSMREEAWLVFEARRENAKKRGEEASTRLTFPMIMLLLAVMLIILVPGFLEL